MYTYSQFTPAAAKARQRGGETVHVVGVGGECSKVVPGIVIKFGPEMASLLPSVRKPLRILVSVAGMQCTNDSWLNVVGYCLAYTGGGWRCHSGPCTNWHEARCACDVTRPGPAV